MRVVNKKLLRTWLEQNNPLAKERLALSIETSVATIDKILAGRPPRLDTAVRMAQFIGVELNQLFPEAAAYRPSYLSQTSRK